MSVGTARIDRFSFLWRCGAKQCKTGKHSDRQRIYFQCVSDLIHPKPSKKNMSDGWEQSGFEPRNVILMFGPPASGKGTHGGRISKAVRLGRTWGFFGPEQMDPEICPKKKKFYVLLFWYCCMLWVSVGQLLGQLLKFVSFCADAL